MFDVERLKTMDGQDATELIGQTLWYMHGYSLESFVLDHVEIGNDVRLVDKADGVWLLASVCRKDPAEWATEYIERQMDVLDEWSKRAGLNIKWTLTNDQQRDQLSAAPAGAK